MALRARPGPRSSAPALPRHGVRPSACETAAVLVAWGFFALAWVKVILEEGFSRVPFTLLVLLVVTVTVLSSTALWIRHNIGIYRRKGPRRAAPSIAVEGETDFLGNRLIGKWDELSTVRVIRITTSGGLKTFAPVDEFGAASESQPRYQDAS
jgi:hypothetical protein